MTVHKVESGIYYLEGDAIPIQLLLTKEKLYQAVMDLIGRANYKVMKEAREMGDAIMDLFKEDYDRRRQEAKREGMIMAIEEVTKRNIQSFYRSISRRRIL